MSRAGSTGERASFPARVAQACARCRRQKLKCDATLPCTSCVRSSAACVPQGQHPVQKASRVQPGLGFHENGTTANNKRPRYSVEPVTRYHGTERSAPPTLSAQTCLTSPGTAHVSTSMRQGHVSPATPITYPREPPRYGANSSAVGFALKVFGDQDRDLEGGRSTIPGHEGIVAEHGLRWTLKRMRMPPHSVILALIDAYFERMHWFIFILHQPSFVQRASLVLSKTTWTREDLCDVVLILMVSAVGLRCVLQDSNWPGHELLRACSLDSAVLLEDMITEVQQHLMDLLDDCRIETVQVCILLGTDHIYHGSPSMAWNILGLSVRVAYALSLHSRAMSDQVDIVEEVRRRCWNHVTVADTFATMIYGRPASLDPAFAPLQPLCECDDTHIHDPTGELAILKHSYGPVTGLTFHILKYKLYEIIKHTLSSFRLLRLNNPISITELRSLVQAVRQAETSLKNWRLELPPFFDSKNWPGGDPWNLFESESATVNNNTQTAKSTLLLQAATLQLTYESAVIFAHRPLLEHRVNLQAHENALNAELDSVPKSVDIAVDAALRISRIPFIRFEHHLSVGFVLMHFFTAGVILCIPPTNHPFSQRAQEAKAGVARIIRASRALRSRSQVARHTEQLLTDLLKVTHKRELDNALHTESLEETRTAVTIASANLTPASSKLNLQSIRPGTPPSHEYRYNQISSSQPNTSFAPIREVSQSTSDLQLAGGLQSPTNGTNPELFSSESVESYLLFNSFLHGDGYGPPINEQLDGALGTFGQSK